MNKWDKPIIVAKLKELHSKGVEISYNALCSTHQSLLSAASYHFKSYRAAVESAGIDYSKVLRRPKWSKQEIIAIIKNAHSSGEDLNKWYYTVDGGESSEADSKQEAMTEAEKEVDVG